MRLYDKIIREAKISSELDRGVFEQLKKAKVFDITNITHLLGDWHEESKHPIPKRPPYNIIWVEWDGEKKLKEGIVSGKCGVLLIKVSRNIMEKYISANLTSESKIMFQDKVFSSEWDEWYVSQGFVDIKNRGNDRAVGLKVDAGITFYCMGEDSTKAEGFTISTPEEFLYNRIMEKRTILGFNLFGLVEEEEEDNTKKITAFVSAEMPLMACALLHCKNVTTETVRVDEKLQKATIKRGHLKLCEYHVIKLKLNEHKINVVRSERGSREVRMHIVRGHFKNLQGVKIKDKGWHWWPAHVRGNPELGIIESGYEVKEK